MRKLQAQQLARLLEHSQQRPVHIIRVPEEKRTLAFRPEASGLPLAGCMPLQKPPSPQLYSGYVTSEQGVGVSFRARRR